MRISKNGAKIVVGNEKESTSGGVKGYVAVYDVATGNRDFIREARQHLSDANSFFGRWVDISDDGKYIIAGATGAENSRGKVFFCRVDGGNFSNGGHTYEILESDTLVYEYKTGPYEGQKLDKEFINAS